MGLADYRALLPGSPAMARLVAAVPAYAGDALLFDLQLVLRGDEGPSTQLGADSRLGQTIWLGGYDPTRLAGEFYARPAPGGAQERQGAGRG